MRIESGTVVANPLLGQVLEDSAVAVSEGMIASVGASDFAPGGERIDARGCWVLPGLVDAHTHLYSALALGMPITGDRARSFPQVLERLWWRLDRALLMEDVRISGLLGAVTGLSRGVTAVFDHHSSPGCTDGSLDALAQAVNTVGIRASLAYEVSDRDGPHASQAAIAENVRFLKRTRAEDSRQLCGHFGLHSLYTLSDATLRCCADANRPLGAGSHLHLLEHKGERARFEDHHRGVGIAEFLDDLGITGPNTIAAHCVHVNGQDILRLAATRTVCVHNPQSNMGNAVGVISLPELLESNVQIGLGTDGHFDMPQQMSTTPLLQNLSRCDPSAFSAQRVVEMVYGTNCDLATRTFGLPIGRIAPGYAADVLVMEYDPPTPVVVGNMASHLVRCLNGGRLRAAIVAGRVVLRNGVVLGLDGASLNHEARLRSAALWTRVATQ